jgi:hypothetical protein
VTERLPEAVLRIGGLFGGSGFPGNPHGAISGNLYGMTAEHDGAFVSYGHGDAGDVPWPSPPWVTRSFSPGDS